MKPGCWICGVDIEPEHAPRVKQMKLCSRCFHSFDALCTLREMGGSLRVVRPGTPAQYVVINKPRQ